MLTGSKRPSTTTWPCGVCIQLLTARIQNDDISVPSATITAENTCPFGTSLRPNSSTPRNAGFEVEGSQHPRGHQRADDAGGDRSEKRLQLVPNWNGITMPETTPMPNETAKILIQ